MWSLESPRQRDRPSPAGGPNRLLAFIKITSMTTLITPSTPITVRPSVPPVTIQPASVIHIRPRSVVEIRPALFTSWTVRPTISTSIAPARAETVRPPERGAWDERGWTRRRDARNEVYEGEYQVGDRRFRGRIEVGRTNRIQAYIHEPPREIRRHRHHACFQQYGIGTGWYVLHWSRAPRNVDEALLYFEQILDESINNG